MENSYRNNAVLRAEKLVSQMTLEEKISQLSFESKPIERLGIKFYNWWGEALHGLARSGTATMFPQAIGLAATFDEDLIKKIGDIISTEGRAKYNRYQEEEDYDIYKGLTYWSPNVNIFRDPRWGRGHETYGEDPFLSAKLGTAFIKGIQGEGEFIKGAACAKHYAVHSGPESGRHSFDSVVSQKDLFETYLPAFKACVEEGKTEAIMGAYNRVNGEPCCGSKTLLEDILRDKWDFEGHVVSDCGAICDFHNDHHVTSTPMESAALALSNGCDLNCGTMYLQLLLSFKNGLVTEEDITRSCVRLWTTRYYLGMMDKTELDEIPYSLVACKEHQDLSVEAAEKSIVLLKNNGILPLDAQKVKTIGVIGPNANSRVVLQGNYHGTAPRYITFLEGIQDEAEKNNIRVHYSEGCHLYAEKLEPLAQPNDRISEAVTVAKQSDVVILCLGLDETLEGEEGDTNNPYASGDKPSLSLPPVQIQLLEKLVSVGTPIILLHASGSAMDLNFANEHCEAILQTWYPGALGGRACADILFGNISPSGKLPITFYKDVDELPHFHDYSMENRTYRYFDGGVLFPFGFGLTYGKVEINNAKILSFSDTITISVDVKNLSSLNIRETLQVYLKNLDSEFAVKNHSLCAIKNIHLKPSEESNFKLEMKKDSLYIFDHEGNSYIDGDRYQLFVGVSQPDENSQNLSATKCAEIQLNLH